MTDIAAIVLLLVALSGCAGLFKAAKVPQQTKDDIRAAVQNTLNLARTLYPHVGLPDSIDVDFGTLRPGRRAATHWSFRPEWGEERPTIEGITFAPWYVIQDPARAVMVTVPHEVAHLVRRMFDPYSPDDHGEPWARVYLALGGPPVNEYEHTRMHG